MKSDFEERQVTGVYEIIKSPRMMTKDEIIQAYDGNWVYIVNADIDAHGTLIKGMPVVLGEFQFAGVEEGIYKQFNSDEYGRTLSYTLLPLNNTITSVFAVGV